MGPSTPSCILAAHAQCSSSCDLAGIIIALKKTHGCAPAAGVVSSRPPLCMDSVEEACVVCVPPEPPAPRIAIWGCTSEGEITWRFEAGQLQDLLVFKADNSVKLPWQLA